jgi:hypothetical protein
MKYLIKVLLVVLLLDQPAVPPLLQQALRQLPGVRLLDPATDLVDEYSIAELQAFGFWPPWILRDFDHDGRPDVAAVVVRSDADGPKFGVLAIHASAPMTAQWVVPLGPERIDGVTNASAVDTIEPLFCIECDSNPWFRWSGRSYESELYAVGEELTFTTYKAKLRLGFFARARRDSRFVFETTECSTAVVRRVAGSGQERWYFVETKGRQPMRGWIPASFVAAGTECVA